MLILCLRLPVRISSFIIYAHYYAYAHIHAIWAQKYCFFLTYANIFSFCLDFLHFISPFALNWLRPRRFSPHASSQCERSPMRNMTFAVYLWCCSYWLFIRYPPSVSCGPPFASSILPDIIRREHRFVHCVEIIVPLRLRILFRHPAFVY